MNDLEFDNSPIKRIEKRTVDWYRSTSLIIAIINIVFFTIFAGVEGLLSMLAGSVLSLGCIWYSDAVGSYTGCGTSILWGAPAITKKTPGVFIAFIGWVLLLSPLATLLISLLTYLLINQ